MKNASIAVLSPRTRLHRLPSTSAHPLAGPQARCDPAALAGPVGEHQGHAHGRRPRSRRPRRPATGPAPAPFARRGPRPASAGSSCSSSISQPTAASACGGGLSHRFARSRRSRSRLRRGGAPSAGGRTHLHVVIAGPGTARGGWQHVAWARRTGLRLGVPIRVAASPRERAVTGRMLMRRPRPCAVRYAQTVRDCPAPPADRGPPGRRRKPPESHPAGGGTHGWPLQVGEHQAPQGAPGLQAEQDLEQVQPRDHRRRQARRR